MADTQTISSRSLYLLRERARREGCSPDELLARLLDDEPSEAIPANIYHKLLEHTSDTIVIFDLNLRYIYANPIMAHFYGLNPIEMIGKTDEELGVSAAQVEQFRQRWDIVIATDQEQIFTFDFDTVDGFRTFESRMSPIRDSQGSIQYLLAITRDVTERKRAEDDMRRTQNVLQRIFDNSHFSLAYMDADFNFIQVNERYAQSDNKTPDYFTGKNHFELYPNAENEAIFRQVVETGQPVTIYAKPFVYPLNPERGATYWDWSLIPVRDADGKVEGLIFTLLDVTERVLAEEKLVESERFVNSILRTTPNFIYIYDIIEDQNIYANASLIAVLGYSPEELQAMGPSAMPRLVHPDDMDIVLNRIRRIRQAADDSDRYQIVYRLLHKDGGWRWVQDQVVIFKRTLTGEAQQVLGSLIDITESKQTEQLLRIKDSAIASSITPITLADLEGRLTYVNEAFLKLWKLDHEDQALGRSVLEFWTSPEAAQQVVETITIQDNYVGELTARLADGATADVGVAASIVRDKNGSPICLMGSFNDVTKHKQAELFVLENERLKARFQKEQEGNALIQRIISALSHDLRTPLTVISTSREMLSRHFDKLTPEKRQEKLDAIGRQVQFALELLEDTVNMARGNLKDTAFRPTPINIAALCQVSVDEVRATVSRNHHWKFVNRSGMETAAIDEVLVSRILLNLLSNAFKYSLEGGEICLELDRSGNWIVLRVIDQGIGISAEDLPHIFEPFYRSASVREISGTGLGLSIVRDCVDRHHGRITVESQPGKGSVFIIELPLSEP